MKLTLTKVYTTDKDKEGNPLKNQEGKPYTRLGILTEEYGDRWLSGFAGLWNKDWREGDVVEAEVEEKGQYLNIRKPNLDNAVADLQERVAKIEEFIGEGTSEGPENPDEVRPEDIPF